MKYRSSLLRAVFIVMLFYWLLGIVVFFAMPPSFLSQWKMGIPYQNETAITALTALGFQLKIVELWTLKQLQLFAVVLSVSLLLPTAVMSAIQYRDVSKGKVNTGKRGIFNISGRLPLPAEDKKEILYVEILEWVGDRSLGKFAIDIINLIFSEEMNSLDKASLAFIRERLDDVESEWQNIGGQPIQLVLLLLEQYLDIKEEEENGLKGVVRHISALDSWWNISINDLDIISAYLKKETEHQVEICIYPYLSDDAIEMLRSVEMIEPDMMTQ